MRNHNISDWVVALAVIVCSVVLFAALAFALSGRALAHSGHSVEVNFSDITGIKPGSQVKYAGAMAGVVSSVRMLTSQERIASGDPSNIVQATLSLNADVPPLPKDIKVSIQADTLLSDKFVQISGGNPSSEMLPDGGVVQGTTPTTFDELARTTDNTMKGIKRILHGKGESGNGTDALLDRIDALIGEAETVMTQAKGMVQDGQVMMQKGRDLIVDNQDRIRNTIARLDRASASIESLSARGDTLLRDNEKNINSMSLDLQVTSANLKVTSTYAKFLLLNLSYHPTRLLWGGGPNPPFPSQEQILSTPHVIPAR